MIIYKTDYTASNHIALYQCESEVIRDFSTYLEVFVFIDGEDNVVFVDSNTGEAAVVLTLDGLDWIFMLSESEIMAATMAGEHYIYDLNVRQFTVLGSEAEMNARINQAVLSASGRDTTATTAAASTNSVTPKTQENNISFPLSEYPAIIYDKDEVYNFNHQRPLSWFHVNGQEGCGNGNCDSYAGTGECEGFARYAHDAYLHIVDDTIGYSAWATTRHSVETDFRFDGSQAVYKTFFNNLNPGAYIRYGKDSDPTPANGVHSIVFVNIDEGGIWVYECNQAYDDDPSHGCGVHYQYYTFERLARQYQYATSYVNHSFTGGITYRTSTTHAVACASCSGYLVESHGGEALSSIRGVFTHYTDYTCCTGGSTVSHTGSATYTAITESTHTVSFSCCSGTFTQQHSIISGVRDHCSLCGWTEGVVIAGTTDSEIKE